jgi:hypothetical protein
VASFLVVRSLGIGGDQGSDFLGPFVLMSTTALDFFLNFQVVTSSALGTFRSKKHMAKTAPQTNSCNTHFYMILLELLEIDSVRAGGTKTRAAKAISLVSVDCRRSSSNEHLVPWWEKARDFLTYLATAELFMSLSIVKCGSDAMPTLLKN